MTDDAGELEVLPEDWQRALCVVAHPDDLEYGSAMAVAKWTAQGKEIAYVLATAGEAGIDSMKPEEAGVIREREERASAALVGVDSVTFLGHPDGMLEYNLALRRDIAREIRRHRPELLLSINHHDGWTTGAGGGLNQADHRVLGQALIDGARDAANRWVFDELLVEGFEPWGGARLIAFASSPRPTHGVDVTGHLAAGIASLEAHDAYLKNLGGPAFDVASFLTEGAVRSGSQLGVEHAVTFEVFSL